jgi:hypothetical protein
MISGKVADSEAKKETQEFAYLDKEMKKPVFCFLLLFTVLRFVQAQEAQRIFAVSDFEGNHAALIRLLRAGGIINHDGHWAFGNGHLVFVGDMIDRGNQVVEILSFVQKLEKAALKKGGQVHYILGNHEIMNLSGDYRYVHPIYWTDSVAPQRSYRRLFSPGTRTGRWLRSKNIIERIGDYLFVHGGIAPAVNALPYSLQALNASAKPLYEMANQAGTRDEPVARLLFDSENTSPFWFRGYYAPYNATYLPPATEQTIDSTLLKFGVRHIITGHTLVADTISMHFRGKLFNTDTNHASGHSEALLIESGSFFRVNADGEKHLLYRRNL